MTIFSNTMHLKKRVLFLSSQLLTIKVNKTISLHFDTVKQAINTMFSSISTSSYSATKIVAYKRLTNQYPRAAWVPPVEGLHHHGALSQTMEQRFVLSVGGGPKVLRWKVCLANKHVIEAMRFVLNTLAPRTALALYHLKNNTDRSGDAYQRFDSLESILAAHEALLRDDLSHSFEAYADRLVIDLEPNPAEAHLGEMDLEASVAALRQELRLLGIYARDGDLVNFERTIREAFDRMAVCDYACFLYTKLMEAHLDVLNQFDRVEQEARAQAVLDEARNLDFATRLLRQFEAHEESLNSAGLSVQLDFAQQ